MKAFEDIRRQKTPFYLYCTAQGEQVWRDIRDRLKAKIAAEKEVLVPERSRDYDEHQDDQRELRNDLNRLDQVNQLLRSLKVIELATTADVVDIGVIVTYQKYDDDGNPLKPLTVQVGEYSMGDSHAQPPIMAYNNHLLMQLLGAKQGEVRTVKLANGLEFDFKILSIRLPQTEAAVRRVA